MYKCRKKELPKRVTKNREAREMKLNKEIGGKYMKNLTILEKLGYRLEARKQPLPSEIVVLSQIDGHSEEFVEKEAEHNLGYGHWTRSNSAFKKRRRTNYYNRKKNRLVQKQRRIQKRLISFRLLKQVSHNGKKYFTITDSGRQLLKEKEYLLYLNDLQLKRSPEYIEKVYRKNPGETCYKVAGRILKEREKEHFKHLEWPAYRDDLVMQSSNFLQAFEYAKMLTPLFQVCWFDYHGKQIPGYLGPYRNGTMVAGILGQVEYGLCKAGCSKAEVREQCIRAISDLPAKVKGYGKNGMEFWKVMEIELEKRIEWL